MAKIKGWRKLRSVPIPLAEGDSFYDIWESDNEFLFIVDDNFGEFIVGVKSRSQMSDPEIISRARTLKMATNKAINYMRSHPNG